MEKHIIVVGGGITGLSIAYLAARSGMQVTVLEKAGNFGGLLHTFPVGGTHLERFYHHFFTHDAEIRWLIDELGIRDNLAFYPTKMGVFHDQRIHDFTNINDLFGFRSLNFGDKLRFGLTGLYLGKSVDWRKVEATPALQWLERWAGPRVIQNIWRPLMVTKFGKYADEVPLSWMVGRMRQRMNSRKGNREALGYLTGSLKVLLDALLEQLSQANVRLIADAPVRELLIRNNKVYGVKTGDEIIEGDQVVLTIPAPPIAELLKPYHPDLANQLASIEYFGAICTILELDRKLSDIYWLNITQPGFPFGGVIEQTNLLSPQVYNGSHVVYLSRYFTPDEAIASLDKEAIKTLMLSRLPEIYPGFKEAWVRQVHVFKTNTAATVCDLNFSRKVIPCRLPVQQLFLANMMHIYPDERSVNNAIRVAAEACRVMGIPSEFVPRGPSLSGLIGF